MCTDTYCAPALPGIITTNWLPCRDGDQRAAALYRRHYSSYEYADRRRDNPNYRNRYLIAGPGEKMVMMTAAADALWVWRKFIDDSGQTGINCAVFRNESQFRSSTLILEAEMLAQRRWPGERMYTYVDPGSIRSSNPGYCFQMAGWKKCGRTKRRNYIILEKYPEDKQ